MDDKSSFRNAEFCDIKHIKKILFATLHEYRIVIPDNYSVLDIDDVVSENSRGQAFVLLKGNSVIGFVILISRDNDCIELKRLYLTPSERGKGLGKSLLKRSIEYAKKNHYKFIRLETTSKFKEAVSLYRKHGFLESPNVEKAPGHDLAYEKIIESCNRRGQREG